MAVYIVDTNKDTVDAGDGKLSLREALALADVTGAADTIRFAKEVQDGTIVLAGSQLTVNSDVTIDGGRGVTVDAEEKSRVLLVGVSGEDIDVTLARLTITGGRTTGTYDGGAGIRADQSATLSLTHVILSGNSTAGDQASGGAISGSYVTITDSTVSGNSTAGESARGGAIQGSQITLISSTVSGNSTAGERASGGAIDGAITLIGSTVSGNFTEGAHANGGGISGGATLTNSTVAGNRTAGEYAAGGGISGGATLTNSTVTANTTEGTHAAGGGISAYGVTTRNSIVAGNAAHGSVDPDIAATVTSNGLNVFGSDVDGNVPGDRENVPTSLLFDGGLADHGGPTSTIALRDATDNPALGHADPDAAPATDQRGEARPAPEDSNPDIGAFELEQSNPGPPPEPATFVVTTSADTVDANDGHLSLREALALADADNLTADRIEFAAAMQGQTITLAGSQLTINSDVTIDGGAGVTLDANQASRVLLVQGLDTDATLQHLTITGGRTTSGGGIFAYSYATLTLDHTTVRDNSATVGRGGGIYAGYTTEVTLTDSAVSGNHASGGVNAGGGGVAGSSVALTRSTVSDNDAAGDGGGISASDVTLTDSSVTRNRSVGQGGGISGSYVTITNSSVSRNQTTGDGAHGGGIAGTVTLTNSKVSGNSTTGYHSSGGGIFGSATLVETMVDGNRTTGEYAGGGGVAARDHGSVELTNSTISNNHTTGERSAGGGVFGDGYTSVVLTDTTVVGNSTTGANASGGGISAGGYESDLTLTNSTVSDNFTEGAHANGGGISGGATLTNSTVAGNRTAGEYAAGGGISGGATLTNSTVTANTTEGTHAAGGGISAYGVTTRNSIVAGNAAHGSVDPDIAATVTSNGLNVFGSDVDGNVPGDRENVPTSLLFDGGLADHGGPTSTIALRDATDNPALGHADPDAAPATDQRGEARPAPEDSNPDIGAFELEQSNPGPPPEPATFVVTTSADTVDANDGHLSLREALALADADNLTADRIEFAAAMQGQTITLAGSQLTINSDVTIDGGAGVTLDANQASRVLLVQGLDTDATLQHLTITGGRTAEGFRVSSGGGIYAGIYAALTLEFSTVSGNSAPGSGGGISGEHVTLTDSTVTGNTAGGGGGGIHATYVTLDGTTVSGNRVIADGGRGGGISGQEVMLTDSTVSGNTAEGGGGGIFVAGGYYGYDGNITLINTVVSDNQATGQQARGGGVYLAGRTVSVIDSTVSDNSSTGFGGGIASFGEITLIQSTIKGNTTTGDDAPGGGIYGPAVITASTVSGNSTAGTRSGGGGIHGSYLTITDSTVSGNETGGALSHGAGIWGITLTLSHSTVSGNRTDAADAAGGGIYLFASDYAPGAGIANSIIAGNQASRDRDLSGSLDFSNGHNIFSSEVAGAASGDLIDVPAGLLFAAIDPVTGGGLLADNGGPTQTVALRDAPDNPALSGGDPVDAPAIDQRGVARPSPTGTDPDIGAFEHPWLSRPADALEYVASYPDLIRALGPDAAAGEAHYRTYGATEERQVGFDGLEYIASYADLIAALGADRDAGSVHFIRYGLDEGRTTSFDGLEYIASHDDLITALGPDDDAGAVHFIRYGADEGRQPDDFDAKQYLANYADLQAAFGTDTEAATVHFIRYGHGEGRSDEPLPMQAAALDFSL